MNNRHTGVFKNQQNYNEQKNKASTDSLLLRESDRQRQSGNNFNEVEKKTINSNYNSLNLNNLNKIPEDIKKKLNLPLFNANIASGVISPQQQNTESLRSMRKKKNSINFEKNQSISSIKQENYIQEVKKNNTLTGYENTSGKNFHKRSNSGNSFTGISARTCNDNSCNEKKIVIPIHNPFNTHMHTKCHKYHTDLDYRLLAEEQLNREKNYVKKETGHNKNLDVLDKSLSKAKCPVSIPIFKQSNDNLYEGYHNVEEENQKTYNENSMYNYSNYGGSDANIKLKDSKNNFNNKFAAKGRKNSDLVLSDVLDVNFSLNSPSGRKLNQFEYMPDNVNKDSQIINNENFIEQKMNFNNISENIDGIVEKYFEALESIMVCIEPVFDRLSLEEKLVKFLENTSDPRRTVRLGAIIALYLCLKKNQFEDELKHLVLERMINLLQNYEVQEELFLVVCLEILRKFKKLINY